jgi:hypothetical protein
MKCPHCLVEYHPHKKELLIGLDKSGPRGWTLRHEVCPACGKIIVTILAGTAGLSQGRFSGLVGTPTDEFLAYPRTASRAPCPAEVPPLLADDYREACLVLADSPKASAALSRRCLQNLLREAAKVRPGNLAEEIQQVIDSGKLPSSLAESVDAIRNIGNFAAHPMKSKTSGEILPVEPGEAEWNLDVLESLFDFYFVQPQIIRKKREALNQKLKDAGKPPMK